MFDAGSTRSAGGAFVQTGGTTAPNDATLDPAGLAEIHGGLLNGSGNVLAAVSNAGTIAPGLSPGVLTIAGADSQAPSGRLLIEVAGVVRGAQFDVLDVTGAASLAGALDMTVADLAQPRPPEVYSFLTAATRSGVFSEVNAACPTGGNRMLVAYRADGAELRIMNPRPADMNCDCGLEFFDIDPFELALFSPAANAGPFSSCDILPGDINGNGEIDLFDIDPLVDLLLDDQGEAFQPALAAPDALRRRNCTAACGAPGARLAAQRARHGFAFGSGCCTQVKAG